MLLPSFIREERLVFWLKVERGDLEEVLKVGPFFLPRLTTRIVLFPLH